LWYRRRNRTEFGGGLYIDNDKGGGDDDESLFDDVANLDRL
jgi:hypothetical protein